MCFKPASTDKKFQFVDAKIKERKLKLKTY